MRQVVAPVCIISFILIAFLCYSNSAYCQGITEVWYGSLDSTPVKAVMGNTFYVDVWIKNSQAMSSLNLLLGSDDRLIDSTSGDNRGYSYYPLSQWDDADFLSTVRHSPPNPQGWSSREFLGFADMGGPPNPWLNFSIPTLALSFKLKALINPDFANDTVNCLGPGFPRPDSSQFRLVEHFSPIYFAVPETCDYVPGNNVSIPYLVRYFKGTGLTGLPLDCCHPALPGTHCIYAEADVNGNCEVTGADVITLVGYYKGLIDSLRWCPLVPPRGR